MKKNMIVQFVCFITNLKFDEFVVKWEQFAKNFMGKHDEMSLQQQGESKGKFKYVSKHEWPQADFKFAFMKGRTSEHFPEHFVKVVQAGGYSPLQVEYNHPDDNRFIKVLAFIHHNDNDIEFYKTGTLHRYLNIYEAFYESCAYGYVLEYFVKEEKVQELLQLLKSRPGIETSIYKECMVPMEK